MTLHMFNPDVAADHGMACAVLYQNIQFWCAHNKANGVHCHEGRYWTYNSAKAFATQFPYLSPDQVRRALDKLIDAGMIGVGNFNPTPYDRTRWFCDLAEIHLASVRNGSGEDAQPIPDIKPDIKPDKEESPLDPPSGGNDDPGFALTPEPVPASQPSMPRRSAAATKKGSEDVAAILAEALPFDRREVAAEFAEHRRAMRKPMSPLAARKMVKRLGELGGDPVAILEHSIANGYQGVFVPPVAHVPRMNGQRMSTTADPWAREAVTTALKEMYRREDEANERARLDGGD